MTLLQVNLINFFILNFLDNLSMIFNIGCIVITTYKQRTYQDHVNLVVRTKVSVAGVAYAAGITILTLA